VLTSTNSNISLGPPPAV